MHSSRISQYLTTNNTRSKL